MSASRSNGNLDAEYIRSHLAAVRARISAAEQRYNRHPGSVALLAVSKAQPAAAIAAAYQAGQRNFGESYLQEALVKQKDCNPSELIWHFIGALQSNKTRQVARHFTWVHSVDRLKIALRLNEQRPATLPPLEICLQVNIGAEPQKAGIDPSQLPALVAQLQSLSKLRLRGLMALPPPSENFGEQRHYFRRMKTAFDALRAQGYPLDTLSMGMSTDLEAAIAEGATLVRIGSALFGDRPPRRAGE